MLVLQGPKSDITNFEGDAIVNAANETMLGGGGVDGAIHRAAGPQLKEACEKVEEVRPGVRCPTGEARVTDGFNLPASKVIHTVGPVFKSRNESDELLRSAFRNGLEKAKEIGAQTVAFPAISCGVFGCPHAVAAELAIDEVKSHSEGLKQVHFALTGEEDLDTWIRVADSELTRVPEEEE